jgi:hypothetical protein
MKICKLVRPLDKTDTFRKYLISFQCQYYIYLDACLKVSHDVANVNMRCGIGYMFAPPRPELLMYARAVLATPSTKHTKCATRCKIIDASKLEMHPVSRERDPGKLWAASHANDGSGGSVES